MKQIYTKMICILAAITLSVGLLSGCGSKETDIAADMDSAEPITIDMMLLNNTSGDGSDFVFKELVKEEFNIDIKFSLNNNQSHFEKLNLLIASNELPDIVAPLPAETCKQIGPKGALVAVDEYFEYLPNFARYLEDDKTAEVSLTAGDDHIYALPRFAPDVKQYKWTPIIRQDYLDEQNIPTPTTYKELFAALRQIKEAHPDIVGIVNRETMTFLTAYGVGYNTAEGMFYNVETDQFEFGPMNSGFKEMITDFAQAWQDGILDKEFFTASEQQWQEKFLNGTGVFTLDWPARANTLEESYQKLHPEDTTFNTTLIDPLVSEGYTKKRLNYSETLGLWTSWGISANTNHLGRILQLVDWMYSDEAQEKIQWGIEGEHYTLNEDGRHQYTSDIVATYNPEGTIDAMNTLGLNHNRIIRVEKDDGVVTLPDELNEIVQGYSEDVEGYETNYKIALTFTEEQTDRIEEIQMVTETLVDEGVVAFVTGTRSMSELDSFIEQIGQQGGAELEEIYAAAYATYKEKMQ